MTIVIREREERDIPGVAAVRIDTWRQAYRGIVPDTYLDELDDAADTARLLQRYRETRGEKNLFFFVAVDEADQVVGFAVGGAEREGFPGYAGELYALYVLPQFQSQGIGCRLAREIFARLHAAELEPVIIWALKDNLPAGAFYRRLGGTPVGEKPIEIGGKTLIEVGFGFVSTASE